MGNKGLFPQKGERSEPRTRTAPKGLPQDEARDAQRGGPPLESPCRTLSLVLSFASKESTIPRRGGSPTARAVVGASIPTRGKEYAPAGAPKGFPLALWKPSGTEAGGKPMGRQALLPRRSRRVIPRRGQGVCASGRAGGFPRSKPSARPALPCAPLVICRKSPFAFCRNSC